MKQDSFLKKYYAYILATVIFFALACIYCFPALQGKVINAGDNVNAESAIQEGVVYTENTGDHSWWTGSMFCGMPNYQIGGGEYKSAKLLAPLDTILHRGHQHPAWVFIIYFFCFFILLRSFDVDKWLAITGAIAIALSSYFIVIIAAGHGGKTSTIALMSVVLAGFHLIFKKKYGLGAILAMIFTAIGVTTHPQMAYYIFMLIGVLWFAELYTHVTEKRIKEFIIATLIFIGSVGLGMGTNCANVFVNAEYASQTMRGGQSDLIKESDNENSTKGLDLDYATQWSYGIDETLSLLIPGFKGGASSLDVGRDSDLYGSLVKAGVPSRDALEFCKNTPMYWGEQPFTAGNVYAGAIVCFLFILGLLIVDGPYKWALLVATLFSIFLSWGHNWMGLTSLFFKYFPLYNKFRAVSSILIVAEIAIPLLGFIAMEKLLEGKMDKKKSRDGILIAGCITAGLCLIFALFGSFIYDFKAAADVQFASQIPDWLYTGILNERATMFTGDCWRSFILITVTTILLLLFTYGKIKGGPVIAIMSVLILVDMWPIDKRYFNENNFITKNQSESTFIMQSWEKEVLKDETLHFRVFNTTTNTFNEARTSYYVKSIGGYNAAKLKRYQDLIDVYLLKCDIPVLNMLNARYFILPGANGQPSAQLNPEAQGNAWFVSHLHMVEGANAAMDALGQIDLTEEAVVESEFAQYVLDTNPGIADDAEIHLTSYTPKCIDYTYSSPEDGAVVFSEIYYPFGWKSYIDGEPVEHFRANYLLRAMNVPAGEHSIHFEFDPDSAKKGDSIATACIILMYLLCAGIIVMAIARRRKKED